MEKEKLKYMVKDMAQTMCQLNTGRKEFSCYFRPKDGCSVLGCEGCIIDYFKERADRWFDNG